MTEAEADALFAHHDAIARAPSGTRLIAREEIYLRGRSARIPAGSHLRVSSASRLLLYAEHARDGGVFDVSIFGDDFHKLEILREKQRPPAPTPPVSSIGPDEEPVRPASPFGRLRTVAGDPWMP